MKSFNTLLAASAIAVFGAGMASAQNFTFEETGSASGDFELNFTASDMKTETSGAEYTFNGGAGTEGSMKADGSNYALTGAIAGQYAMGSGDSVSDTNGNDYAKARFESGALSANGGVAYSEKFGNDPAKVSYKGLALAGGAGGVTTGLSDGSSYQLNVAGDAAGKYKLKQQSSTTNP